MPTSDRPSRTHSEPMRVPGTLHARASLAVTRLLTLVCVAAISTRLSAQGTGSLSAGLASVRYDDTLSVTAATVEPTLRYDSDLVSLLASGTYAQLAQRNRAASWTSQGELAGSAFTPGLGPLRGEIVGRAGMSAHEDGTRTGEWETLGRAHFMRTTSGAWIGGGGGRTWDGASWREVRAADAGAWVRGASSTLVATATPTSIAVPNVGSNTRTSVRYTDVELSGRLTPGRVELAGTLGHRAGNATVAASDERTWGSGTASVRLSPRLMLIGSAGSYPVDFAQGFPGGRYLSVALGIVPRATPSDRDVTGVVRSDATAARDGEPAAFTVEALPSGARRVRLRAPSAVRVEVAGDFSAWQPIELRRAGGGWWETELTVAAGIHELSARVNGGTWEAPPGLTVIVDELGGRSGLLVIP
jgi:hypothetical protein